MFKTSNLQNHDRNHTKSWSLGNMMRFSKSKITFRIYFNILHFIVKPLRYNKKSHGSCSWNCAETVQTWWFEVWLWSMWLQCYKNGSLKSHKQSIHEGLMYGCDQYNYEASWKGQVKKTQIVQTWRFKLWMWQLWFY